MLGFIKRLIPRRARATYHRWLALAATLWYGRPSRHLIVIGITGTDGKTTTAMMLASILQAAGHRVGLSSSLFFQVAEHRWANETHMTMPGRFALQRLLRQMVRAHCRYAIVEVSSEGLLQHRHAGIDFDLAMITNISPEHLKSHGTFENYRSSKGRLFGKIIKGNDKAMDGETVKKATIVNLDDPEVAYFLKFWAEERHGVTLSAAPEVPMQSKEKLRIWTAGDIVTEAHGSRFRVDGQNVSVPIPGRYNILNALEAIAAAAVLRIPWASRVKGIADLQHLPGRFEEITTGKPWRVVVDYAVTPKALESFYQALQGSGATGIISVFGAAGGGRDTWKRPELGKIAAKYCRKIILTTDDPYNDDPQQIAEAIRAGVPEDKRQNVEIVVDRREAIKRAMSVAQTGDAIAITGMGAETSMMVKGKKMTWNDAKVVKELIR